MMQSLQELIHDFGMWYSSAHVLIKVVVWVLGGLLAFAIIKRLVKMIILIVVLFILIFVLCAMMIV